MDLLHKWTWLQVYSFIGLSLLYELLHSIFYFQIIHIKYPLVLLKFALHLHDLKVTQKILKGQLFLH